MSVPILHNEQSQSITMNRNQSQSLYPSALINSSMMLAGTEQKVPQIQYPQQNDPTFDFKLQSHKLIQANSILTELIKQTIQEKYVLSDRIIKVGELIKKLENRNIK